MRVITYKNIKTVEFILKSKADVSVYIYSA